MTCAACGSVLAQDVRFCPHCGAPVTLPPQSTGYASPPPLPPQPLMPGTRVGRNLQALGVLWLVYAGLRVLTGLLGIVLGMAFLHGIFGAHHVWNHGWGPFGTMAWGPFGHIWMAAFWPLALSSLLIGAGVSVLVGCALLTRQPWARILAIVFGIFALIHFWLGTALGIYTLWVLAPRASGEEYAALSYFHHRG